MDKLTVKLPSLVSSKEFEPSGLMIRTLIVFLHCLEEAKETQSPTDCLKAQGKDKSNWYKWQAKEGFNLWWTKNIETFHTSTGLSRVHNSLYQAALMPGGATDRKLYLERFDKDYKPATSQEYTFPGLRPPDDTQAAIERSRERARQVASEVVKTDATKISNTDQAP